jgi:alpha/beta superfamily hydrolase
LVVVGEDDPFTYLPVQQALQLLEKENRQTIAKIIPGADHDFSGKEKELLETVKAFVQRVRDLYNTPINERNTHG